MWTRFMDMHSGGGTKESPYEYLYIEAPEAEAKVVFFHRFGHNPERVSCTCCGEDYAIYEYPTLERATAYERGCDFVYRRPDGTECEQTEGWVSGVGMVSGYTSGYEERANTRESWASPYHPLADFVTQAKVKVIRAEEMLPTERVGEVPEQGYVWKD